MSADKMYKTAFVLYSLVVNKPPAMYNSPGRWQKNKLLGTSQVTDTAKRTSRQHKQKNNTHRQRQEILIVKSCLLKRTKGLAMWPNYHTSTTHLAGAAISSTRMNICILRSSQFRKSLHKQYTVCFKASFNSLKINANNSSQTEQTEAREICPSCVFHPGKQSLKSLSYYLCIRHKQRRQEVLGLN